MGSPLSPASKREEEAIGLVVVGVTCTGMKFYVAFAYLEVEYENNFVWALERFRGIFHIFDGLPKWLSLTEI